jgi:hypothetical protein
MVGPPRCRGLGSNVPLEFTLQPESADDHENC